MTRKIAIPFLAVVCLCSVLIAQEQVSVTDIAVDKLLEGVRVTVACTGNPNVSSFLSTDPPSLVVDIMGAVSKLKQNRIESAHYPVTAVTVQPSEAATGLRVTIQLRVPVEHKVTVENGLVVVDLGTRSIPPPMVADQKDQFAGRRLSLYVKDADLTDILRMISSQFNLNLLATQDVKSLVTVRLSDVPLRAGLEAVLKAGLCNMVEGKDGIIVVKPVKKDIFGETQVRVFELNYSEAVDVAKIIPKMLSSIGTVDVGYRRVADAGGSNRTNLVVVTDIPEALERVAEFLAEYDEPVPQIMIEAKFVETTLSATDIYGIQWNLSASATSGRFDGTKDFGLPLVFNNMVLGKLNLGQFSATMDILQSRGKSRVLANPSTMTLDNHTAIVSMGTDVPIREISSDPRTGLVLATWKTQSVPIQLQVTPHVTSDGMVNMNVKPSVEAITGWVGSADDQRPMIARRSAESNIAVRDGEVAVIGGLVRDEETRNVGKIPLLGDIPILGDLLFKKTTINHTKNDLIIFIIPHIVRQTEE
ncbi:MAG: AMIN domain-containing protein [candidate division WOR-3 bacterium]|nr:AMIN domain-containing protein [candidate division WOR-3 bacterium]